MKKIFLLATSVMLGLASCKNNVSQQEAWVNNALNVASYQLKMTTSEITDSAKLPRSIWTGYTVDFLVSQLEREAFTFKDSLWANPPASKLG